MVTKTSMTPPPLLSMMMRMVVCGVELVTFLRVHPQSIIVAHGVVPLVHSFRCASRRPCLMAKVVNRSWRMVLLPNSNYIYATTPFIGPVLLLLWVAHEIDMERERQTT